MAVLSGSISAMSLGGYLPTGSTDWPDEFLLWETDDCLGDPLISEGLMSLTDAYTPVSPALWSRALSAVVSPCYLQDFYYRIHVVPSSIDLGQLLSAETRDVTVWNAFFTPQTLSSITKSGATGITVPEPVLIPHAFAPLEEITYSIGISISGPSTIGAMIFFNFSALYPPGALFCAIVGSRIMLWRWPPEGDCTEELRWKTDVIQMRAGEQRIAYLDAPRQVFKHDFLRPPEEMTEIKAVIANWVQGVWGWPIWGEFSIVSAGIGASAINFDTSFADYQAGGRAALWESPEKAAAVSIVTVRADGIDIDPPLEDAWTGARIMPLQTAITPDGFSFKRGKHPWTPFSAEFLCTDNKDLGDESAYPLYRGCRVLTDSDIVVGDLSERISRPLEQIDNGQGPIAIITKQDYAAWARAFFKATNTRAERWAFRRWLHARRGKQKAFWLPTWHPDLRLAATATALTTDIEILKTTLLAVHGAFPCDCMLRLTSGSILYRRILSATAMPSGNTMISIDSALGVEVDPEDADLWCFMDLVRLNTDTVELQHQDPCRMRTTIPVMRAPE